MLTYKKIKCGTLHLNFDICLKQKTCGISIFAKILKNFSYLLLFEK